MNIDYKSDYDDAYRTLMDARSKTDYLLRDAAVPDENNATHIITESETLQNLEDSARQRWEAARDAYLR